MNTPTAPAELAVKPIRLSRTDEQRVAELQARIEELSRVKQTAALIPNRARTSLAKKRKTLPSSRPEDALDLELEALVKAFVVSVRDVIRKALIAQASQALMKPARAPRVGKQPRRAS